MAGHFPACYDECRKNMKGKQNPATPKLRMPTQNCDANCEWAESPERSEGRNLHEFFGGT